MTADSARNSHLPASPEQGGGILSKVVKFVSNPTKDWKDLASRMTPSQQSSVQDDGNAQRMRERIERKRRNDFIRKAEFAHLRKIINARKKQRQPTLPATVLAKLAMAQNSESAQQQALRQNRSRSGTLEKINEIEAQLSKQWWQAAPSERAGADALGQSGADGALQDGAGDFFAGAQSLFFADAVTEQVRLAREHMAGADDQQAFAANEWVERLRGMDETLQFFGFQEEFVHQADLEEAAILFASQRVAEAEKGLVDVIRKQTGGSEQDQIELWMTLFDLYRAIGVHDRFDAVAIDFAKRFDRSAPTWVSLPEQLGFPAQDKDQRRPFSWVSPPEVTAQTVATLVALLERSASPYQFNWARLTHIQPDAVKPLAAFLHRLATLPGVVKFDAFDKLSELLQARTPLADASVDAAWWLLRLAVLRVMNDAEQFETVALDYTITYEESPPMFQAPIIHYSATGETGFVETAPAKNAAVEGKPSMQVAVLQGRIENDATSLLEQAVGAFPANAPIAIDCSKLISIDFSAAGSVLNWAALQQSKGRVVVFSQLHRLIAVFFNVIGINEHARIVPRKN